MRICKIHCIVHFCLHTHTSRSIGLPPFLHNHCIALWSKSVIPLCQAIPTQSRDHWNWIHRLVQDIGELQGIAGWSNQMIGGWGEDSDAREEMTDICWHTVQHYITAQHHRGHILLFTQYHRPLQTHSVQDLSWTTEGPIQAALLTLGHWDNYQAQATASSPELCRG